MVSPQQTVLEFELERKMRKRAGKTVTITDYKAAGKVPQMPPLNWDEVCTLFTMWALLLKMLFGKKQCAFARPQRHQAAYFVADRDQTQIHLDLFEGIGCARRRAVSPLRPRQGGHMTQPPMPDQVRE